VVYPLLAGASQWEECWFAFIQHECRLVPEREANYGRKLFLAIFKEKLINLIISFFYLEKWLNMSQEIKPLKKGKKIIEPLESIIETEKQAIRIIEDAKAKAKKIIEDAKIKAQNEYNIAFQETIFKINEEASLIIEEEKRKADFEAKKIIKDTEDKIKDLREKASKKIDEAIKKMLSIILMEE